jgi:hypothetical protein
MHRTDILISRPSHAPLRGHQVLNLIGIVLLLLLALAAAI